MIDRYDLQEKLDLLIEEHCLNNHHFLMIMEHMADCIISQPLSDENRRSVRKIKHLVEDLAENIR
jgi:hypothetical protein